MTKDNLTDLSQYSAAQLRAELRRRERAKAKKAKAKGKPRAARAQRGGDPAQD